MYCGGLDQPNEAYARPMYSHPLTWNHTDNSMACTPALDGCLPVPGSPSSRIPFGGFPPMDRYIAGSFRYCKGKMGMYWLPMNDMKAMSPDQHSKPSSTICSK